MALNNSFDANVDTQITGKYPINAYANKGNNSYRILDGKKFGGVLRAGVKILNDSGTLKFIPDTDADFFPYSANIKFCKITITDCKGNFANVAFDTTDGTSWGAGVDFAFEGMEGNPSLIIKVHAEATNTSDEGDTVAMYQYEVNTASIFNLLDTETIDLSPESLSGLQ